MDIRKFLFQAFILSFVSCRLLADGLIIIHHRPPHLPHPPRPHPHGHHHYAFAPLEVVYHRVEVKIEGQRAVTRVEQEFLNPNNATLEGDYVFPLPKEAHIDRFTMKIGDRDMEAELLDAAKARAIYEEIVRSQRDPALLEYSGRGAFRVRIFPIEPHSRKKVSLTYSELLKADSGLVGYTYPLNTEKFSARPLEKVSVKVEIVQDSPIKALYSPTHEVEIRRDGEKRAVVGFEVSQARPDKDFQVLFSTSAAEMGVHLITHTRPGEDGWFLLLAAPGPDSGRTGKRHPKDVVFVLDTSGSMAGKKLDQAKKALTFCVENLQDEDRFEIVRFSTEAEPLFAGLKPSGAKERTQARDWIDKLRPIGGTAIDSALSEALKLRPSNPERPFFVIFLTDGQPTVGETNEDKILANVVRSEGGASRIFCFGIGTDVNTHLLDKIVERTRAASQFVLPDEDLELKVSSFFTKIKEPALTDVRVSFPEGIRMEKALPNPLPDLFRGEQIVLTGRYRGSGEGEIVLEGRAGGEVRRIAHRVQFPAHNPGNEFVAQLWAMRRVGWLLDEIRLRGENREVRDEVASLARQFGIVTPFTSLLIVEDEARRNVPLSMRSLQKLDAPAATATKSRLEQGWRELSKDRAGGAAAYNARGTARMKSAENLAPQKLAADDNKSALAVVPSAPSPSTVANPTGAVPRDATIQRELDAVEQQAVVINGRSFYQQADNSWLDSQAQQISKTKVRVAFASESYFELLAKNADVGQWLALGRNVQFVLGETLYEVHD